MGLPLLLLLLLGCFLKPPLLHVAASVVGWVGLAGQSLGSWRTQSLFGSYYAHSHHTANFLLWTV
jgi:hypothetical protein